MKNTSNLAFIYIDPENNSSFRRNHLNLRMQPHWTTKSLLTTWTGNLWNLTFTRRLISWYLNQCRIQNFPEGCNPKGWGANLLCGNFQNYIKQECIPVGCVPPARWPYPVVCYVSQSVGSWRTILINADWPAFLDTKIFKFCLNYSIG